MSMSIKQAQVKGNLNPTVFNGIEVNPPFKYPYMVAVCEKDEAICGGTLYKENIVLTAAHCVYNTTEDFFIKVHRHNLTKSDAEENGKTYKVTDIKIHPSYLKTKEDGDIAILKLDNIPKSNKPLIELDDGSYAKQVGMMTKALGWGFLNEDGKIPDVLQQVDLPIFNLKRCKEIFKIKEKNNYSSEYLCAGYEGGDKDVCSGDSGGPLAVYNKDKMTLLGTVVGGGNCVTPTTPGIYTRIAFYTKWILANS